MFRKIFTKKSTGDETDPSSPVSAAGLSAVFADCYDFESRELMLGGDKTKKVTLCFIDGLVSGSDIAEQVIRPLTSELRFSPETSLADSAELMLGGLVYVYTAKKREKLGDAVSDLLNGFCAVIPDGEQTAVTFEVKSKENRSVDAPKEEKVVKGAKDAFVEVLKVNTTLLRRKLRNRDLKIKELKLGEKTNTQAALIYMDGFTNKRIVDEAEKRLSAIKTEGVLTAAVIEENIADNAKTPFPQIIMTERPDKFAMNILEGRVGIMVDGLPMGFLAPGTFSQFFKVPEDHANHCIIASAMTLLRYLSLILSLLLPAFYVAVAMYHHEMIPIKMMQSIIDAKQSVPFPTAFEVLAMLVAFELLQEAGLRLPNPIGETVSIIGALIVGQSAVEAKVVSPVVVVVIALAGIAGYTMPSQDMSAALRICRFALVILAILMGLFGMAVGVSLLIYHLASLETFGVPYMSPFAGADGRHIARALLRYPMKKKRDAEPELEPEEEK